MRRARVTYQGAFQHAINHGYNGMKIFSDDNYKKLFPDLLRKYSKILKKI